MIKAKLLSNKDIPYFLISLLLLIFIFRGVLFSHNIFFERDSTVLEIPARKLCVQLLKEGNFALWTDAYGNGQPFLANPKHAVLYPSTLLYLIFPFFLAFKLHYLLHFALAWLGTYLLGKSYSLSKEASFLGATVFIFSGIFLSSVEFYNHAAALCWMPWILMVLLTDSKNYTVKLIKLALLWTLLILAGTPFVIVITILFGLFQILFFRLAKIRKSSLLIFSLLIALLLSSVQLIPSFDLLKRSSRESSDAGTWSFEAIQVFNFVFPHFLGNDREPGHDDYWGSHLFDKGFPLYYSLYLGFGVFILAFFGMKKPFDQRHRLFICGFILFIFLAFGAFTPLFLLLKNIPPFSAIRYPVKYLIGVTFSLAMLASLGYERLARPLKEKSKNRKIFFGSLVLILFLFLIFKNSFLELLSHIFVFSKDRSIFDLGNYIMWGLILLVIFSFFIFLLSCRFINKKILVRLFLAVVVLDLAMINQFINPVVPQNYLAAPAVMEDLKPPLFIHREENIAFNFKEEVGGAIGMHKYLWDTVYPYVGIGANIHYHFSKDFYDLYDSYYQGVLDFFNTTSLKNKTKMLTSSGCAYYIGHHALPDLPATKKTIQGYPIYLHELPEGPAPLRLVYNVIEVKSFDERIEIFFQDDFDPLASALVEKGYETVKNIAVTNGDRVEKRTEYQGEGHYSVTNTFPALLVISGNYSPGWKAWDNGKKCDIFRVNLVSKGVFLPPDQHEVKVEYLPKSFTIGLWISAVSWFMILSVLIASFFNKRNKSS